jgi:hypothetical protein
MDKSNVVKMMNTLEMVGFIKTNGTACRFVSMTIKTPVVKIKVGNPWHKVSKGKVVGDCNLFKVSKKIGLLNANYNTSVRNRIAEKLGVTLSEVEYENGEVWYEHLKTSDGKNLPLVQHKDETKRGNFYLQYFPHKSENVYVTANGETVPDAMVEQYLYAESERAEFKPCVIAVNLTNVCQLKASGVVIEMPDFDQAALVLAD